jgi:hypothetical protein
MIDHEDLDGMLSRLSSPAIHPARQHEAGRISGVYPSDTKPSHEATLARRLGQELLKCDIMNFADKKAESAR